MRYEYDAEEHFGCGGLGEQEATGGFPKWGYPMVPPVIINFRLGFSLINHPFGGAPMETGKWDQMGAVLWSLRESHF